ncbi:hypothetical protein TAMA11512_00150 [Selenomonas sp. TAMA-11512]|uniref:DUF805 domain-containing protein n=1 Tax=Selenomonas sp. TAMA-11512 TaxID=3095337 RepID=UPI003085F566|nr:hypothetical protein TAMA11512_00150 [Selenomonas sp. TAMA-11512]
MNRETLNKLYERWLCPEGRMKRSLFLCNFFGTLGAAAVAQGIGIAVLMLLMVFLGVEDVQDASDYVDGLDSVLYVVFILLGVICVLPTILGFYSLVRTCMRRWHDIGHGDKSFLCFFVYIPVLLFMVLCVLSFMILIVAAISAAAIQMFGEDRNLTIAAMTALILLGGLGCYHAALLLYLCVRKSEMRDNAYGTLESRGRMMPEIRTRPAESISLIRAFLRVKGRLNRKRFVFGILLAGFLGLPVQLILMGFHVDETGWGAAVTMILAMLLPIGLYMQRLQDVGKSPLWWAVPTGIACVVWVAFAGMDIFMLLALEEAPEPSWAEVLCVAYMIFYYLYDTFLGTYLYFAPGDEGENAYGADPLVRVSDEACIDG